MLSGFEASKTVGRHPFIFYPLTGLLLIFFLTIMLYFPTLGRLIDLFNRGSK